MATGPTRVYRPDLTDHFILVHPKKQWGLIKWNTDKSRAWLQTYRFDEDGDLRLGKRQWIRLRTSDRGPFFQRQHAKAYLHDFHKPLPNPYA
jgi:hypothetical protein